MVELMLDDLRGKAAELLFLPMKAQVIVRYFNAFIAFRLPFTGKRQTAFVGKVAFC